MGKDYLNLYIHIYNALKMILVFHFKSFIHREKLVFPCVSEMNIDQIILKTKANLIFFLGLESK